MNVTMQAYDSPMELVATNPATPGFGLWRGAGIPSARFPNQSTDTALSNRFALYLRRVERGDATRIRPRHVNRTLAKLEARRQDVLDRLSNENDSADANRDALKLAVLDRQIGDTHQLLDWVSTRTRK